jgi:hypothetical protein
MIEIAPNRFIVAKRIVGANIYTKDNKIRVAITLDTVNKEEATVFSGEMATAEQAKTFIFNLIQN